MATITKGASGLVLTTAANWVGGVAPTSADVARWTTTSVGGAVNSSTGNHTGTISLNGIQVDNAAAAVAVTSGTVTITGTDAFVNGLSNTAEFYVQSTGVLALGSGNRNFKIAKSGGTNQALILNTNGALTGSGTLTIIDASAGTLPQRQVVFGAAHTGFTGTVVLESNTALLMWNAAQTCLTAANIIVNGPLCTIGTTFSGNGATLGAAGRTLTLNADTSLGFSTSATFTIASNVVLGAATRTFSMGGAMVVSGAVTGTAGMTKDGLYSLTLSGNNSGLSGPITTSAGTLSFSGNNRPSPSSVSVASGASCRFIATTTDYSFPCDVSGLGILAINGAHSGLGVTFDLGRLTNLTGALQVFCTSTANETNAKLIFYELPMAEMQWLSAVSTSATVAATMTYSGAGHTASTGILVDSRNNGSTASLTSGSYVLNASGSGALVLSGAVYRDNTIGTASARMNLTLGGSNTGDNTLSGVISEVGTNGAILGITKVNAGRWVLSGNNTHTGVHSIQAGTLAANSATALGAATSTGGVTIIGTGVLELGDGVTLNKSVTDFSLGNATNPVQTAGTSTLQSKQVTLSVTPTFTVPSGRKLTIAPQGAGVIGGSGTGITKAGDGELELTATANTFTGAVTVSAGTLTVGSVANANAPAAWGQANGAVLVSGTLKYNGATGSSSRAVQMTGSAPTLDASGSGALTLSNVTQDTTAKTMTLRGTSTNANTISSAIANNTGAVSLAKEDAGRWVLLGALSYTGTTVVNDGTLRVETGNSNTTSGAVTIGASGIVELVTGTLASAGATSGEVLGTGNVTVNGGTIKTRGGSTQQGQVRYGGNLTFGSGSSLYIGAAA